MTADRGTASPKPARVAASTWFYPAAALQAAVVLPWSVLALLGAVPAPASLATPFGHAHEMLLGFALAVVAGNQLGVLPLRRLQLLFAAWVLARVTFLALPAMVAAFFDIVFIAALGFHVAPRLFRAAKKLRNQALPAILTALCLGAIAFDVAVVMTGVAATHSIVTAVVLLFAALMLFMGGRIIAPIAAGQLYRQGTTLEARVQPRIEAALVVTMAVAIVAAVAAPQGFVLRLACLIAAALALVRLLRWRLWACKGRPDLWCLAAGYAWLAAGLLSFAATDSVSLRTAAAHVVTIGALGTLTFNVMAFATLSRARLDPAGDSRLVWGTVLIGMATVFRVRAATATAGVTELYLSAAACWSAAFLIAVWLLVEALRAYARRPVSTPLRD